MGNNATNQKKGIVTRGSGHIAESSGASLPYFEKLYTGHVMDDNHIETSKCSAGQAARRTFIAGHAVIHNKSKIGIPFGLGGSRYDRPHSFAKNNPLAYKWFAEPDEQSPDTKVEGNWVVRTFDKTKQDGNNGPGKFSPAPGSTEILDESELLFQQCAVEKIKLECKDGRSTMGGELHVYIGDVVTVTAYRVNASETDPEKRLDVQCYITRLKQKKNPPPEETRHAAFVLTRNGRFVMPTLSWSEIKNKTLVGQNKQIPAGGASKKLAKVSVLELKEDWLLESDDEDSHALGPVGGSYESYDRRQDGASVRNDLAPDVQQRRLENRASRAQSAVTDARKKSKRGNAKPGAIGRAEDNRREANQRLARHERNMAAEEAQRGPNAEANRALHGNVRLLLDSWKIVMQYFAFQPLQINIEAHGCSPGANAVIKAFPKEELGAELAVLKDFPGRKVVDQIKSLITTISNFFKGIKGANLREFGPDPQLYRRSAYNIDLYFFRSKKSTSTGKVTKEEDLAPSIELKFAWKELTRDANPAGGEIKGRKAWMVHKMWEVDVKLERLLGLFIQFEIDLNFCLGPFGKFVADVLKFFGVKTGIFLDINIGLSVGVGGTIGRDEYGKWTLNSPNVPLKSVIQLSLVVRVGRFLEAGFRITGRWEPKFHLGKNDKGQLCIKRTPASFDIVLTFEAKVDILGWDLDYAYEIQKWPFTVPGSDLIVFGDGS